MICEKEKQAEDTDLSVKKKINPHQESKKVNYSLNDKNSKFIEQDIFESQWFPDRINIEGKWQNVWVNPNTHEWKPRK